MISEIEQVYCFPTCVYVVKKPQFLEVAKTVVYENIEKKKAEQCVVNDVYPVCMTDSLLEDTRIDALCEYIGRSAWEILANQGYDMSKFSTTFTEMWAQHHYKYSGMDQHVHPYGAQIVGFYFVKVPNNGSIAVFHDPRSGKVQIGLPEANNTQITGASSMINVVPEEGMLIFANSWLPHSFTRNQSEDPMTFIHFNLGVIANPPAPAAEVI
jgi:uncharacterized protein (TIGR02466 family)